MNIHYFRTHTPRYTSHPKHFQLSTFRITDSGKINVNQLKTVKIGKIGGSRIKSITTTKMMIGGDEYDRAIEVKKFDESKIGVKGLVDSGITTIPRFFAHKRPQPSPPQPCSTRPESDVIIPTIDLSDVDSDRRQTIVDQVRRASSELGFFQIKNHGIPQSVLDRAINSIRAFHELPTEAKAKFYSREIGTGVAYASNFDLYQSKAASWRDTIQIRLGPKMCDPMAIPEVCRTAVIEWQEEMTRVAEVLMGLLSEGLGLDSSRLKELTCLEGKVLAGHYYPYCPEPDLTVGLASHTDPGVMTVVQQSEVGGVEVKYGEEWVIVKPVPGNLVINIGDILQIMSNEVYKSVQHRVSSRDVREPRTSLAIFFNPSNREGVFGPQAELITPEKPALYREFTYGDFMSRFFSKELDGKTMTNYYRV